MWCSINPRTATISADLHSDRLMMFKIVSLQSLYSLSNDQMSARSPIVGVFHEVSWPKVSDKALDAKTIWKFRETLIQEEMIEALFYRFNQALDDQSVFAKTGQIVDAYFVEVHKQRNSRDENKQIKQGGTPENWKKKPNKLRQKDHDVRWTKKNKMSFYMVTRTISRLITAPNLSAPMPSSVMWQSTIHRNSKPLPIKVMLISCSSVTVLTPGKMKA